MIWGAVRNRAPMDEGERVTILVGDCRERLRELPAESVHCVVTSPPYFGLRDYGTGQWEGGDPCCDHRQVLGGNGTASAKQVSSGGTQGYQFRSSCGKCGAHRIDRQIGLEQTPDAYVAELVAVFRECRRVLRADGTLWLNLGDSYASGEVGRHDHKQAAGICTGETEAGRSRIGTGMGAREQRNLSTGLPSKNLIGIPWRVAFALQADGWWLRQDIIWSKPNPMPESVTDRCTKSHEYLFLLGKSERYSFDAVAIAEPFSAPPRTPGGFAPEKATGPMVRSNGHSQWEKRRTKEESYPNDTRNRRSVWTVATQPFSEAHFATFPPDLIEPCIKAGTSEKGCCAKCGAPWVRDVERTPMVLDRSERTHDKGRTRSSGTMVAAPTSKTLGWSPSCSCGSPAVPCTVLDPFGGAGTTGLVADRLGRNAILIELNPAYAGMARDRLHADAGMFAAVSLVPA